MTSYRTPTIRLSRRGRLALTLGMLVISLSIAGYLIGALARFPGTASGRSAGQSESIPFGLDDANGYVRLGDPIAPERTDVPALERLDPMLLDAVRRASADARAEGIDLVINSGWRTAALQEWMLKQAITEYGSERAARRFVSTPENSRHVSGEAVDFGPAAGAAWVEQNGARYGLCRIYENEPWHFELATDANGRCPALRRDAA
ncbi:hypothetical protein D9V32_08340 [Mycetocola tolaasinivorans]|uniref:D-alanyl-D-alanine carboxypeptidase-like core domain-containing protein n=1 Tax=Mycetocola tolaasinivorans TaxID=76635 RepID=A0A3L7A9A0_9MICO|nr:M15 family metallopeptidase [Mycetocola tolaasinivorans]RLP76151.1 hypothetical protein D9V32_08340 [Mycetocola tolaasinivorans]